MFDIWYRNNLHVYIIKQMNQQFLIGKTFILNQILIDLLYIYVNISDVFENFRYFIDNFINSIFYNYLLKMIIILLEVYFFQSWSNTA